MRSAIYCRVSTERQAGADRVSLDVQRERCERYCEEKGWDVVAVETDHESGLKATRAGYQRILALARSNAIDCVVVYAASRFGRRASEVLARIEELRDVHKVELHSTMEDLSSFLMVGITAVLNEEQSRVIARLSAPAKLHRAREGYWLAHAPFGTTNNHGVLEPDNRVDILRGMFERAAGGESVRQITLWANALIDRPLTREGVREILRSDAYVGRTRWAGENLPAKWEPMVDVKTWKRAQLAVRNRKWTRAPIDHARPHWIVGLAHCGECGHRMHRRTIKKSWGTRYEYLYCGRKDRETIRIGCGARQMTLLVVQEAVLCQLREARMSVDSLERWLRDLDKSNAGRLATRDQQRTDLAAEKGRLHDRLLRARQGYMDRVIEAVEFHRMTAGIKEAISALELREFEDPLGVDLEAARFLFGGEEWIAMAEKAPLEFREFLRVFVERIECHPEPTIVWRDFILANV